MEPGERLGEALVVAGQPPDGKCQNSGRATMTVVIFPTWWTIAAK